MIATGVTNQETHSYYTSLVPKRLLLQIVPAVISLYLVCGCGSQSATPDSEYQELRAVFSAYNDASIVCMKRHEELSDLTPNERNAKSLLAYYETLTPSLDLFTSNPNELSPEVEVVITEWHQIAGELHQTLSEIVETGNYAIIGSPDSAVSQLLIAEEAVQAKIAEHFSGVNPWGR